MAGIEHPHFAALIEALPQLLHQHHTLRWRELVFFAYSRSLAILPEGSKQSSESRLMLNQTIQLKNLAAGYSF